MLRFPRTIGKKGFSLLEMTVVLAIVAVMTAIILWNLPDMKGGLSIDIVAQEVAIYVRGAQVYSRATKSAAEAVADPSRNPDQAFETFHSFGMHFAAGQDSFFLWSDKLNNADKQAPDYSYHESGDAPPEEFYELPRGFVISKLSTEEMFDTGMTYGINKGTVDIVFKRPDPEAHFACTSSLPDTDGSCPTAYAVWIELQSANGLQKRYIRISNNGQIVVKKEAPGPITS